jgi:hypothetical protein
LRPIPDLIGASHDRVWNVRVKRIFPARGPRSQHIQADARHNSRQPCPQILDAGDAGPAKPKPAFLHGILSIAG